MADKSVAFGILGNPHGWGTGMTHRPAAPAPAGPMLAFNRTRTLILRSPNERQDGVIATLTGFGFGIDRKALIRFKAA